MMTAVSLVRSGFICRSSGIWCLCVCVCVRTHVCLSVCAHACGCGWVGMCKQIFIFVCYLLVLTSFSSGTPLYHPTNCPADNTPGRFCTGWQIARLAHHYYSPQNPPTVARPLSKVTPYSGVLSPLQVHPVCGPLLPHRPVVRWKHSSN